MPLPSPLSYSINDHPITQNQHGPAPTNASMMSEASKLANDPAYLVEVSIGDPFPELTPHDPSDPSNLGLSSIYFTSDKRFLFKKVHFK